MPRILLLLALLLASCATEQPVAAPEPLPERLLITVSDSSGSHIVHCDSDGANRTTIAAGVLVSPPRAGKILYTGGRTLHIASIDGGNDKVLLSEGEWEELLFGEISPDGGSFLIVEAHPGIDPTAAKSFRLAIRKIDGTNRREIAGDLQPGTGAEFSPDGTHIAFIASDRRIYSIRPDGSGRLVLTSPNRENIQRSLAGAIPDWSPDGELLLCDALQAFANVPVVHADGRDSSSDGLLNYGGLHPAWSPSGATIVYGDFRKITEGNFPGAVSRWVVDPTGGSPITPRWSRDGIRVLFTSFKPGWSALRLMIANLNNASITKIDTNTVNGYWVEG
jgi:dipeptidyl aminopeptidase/acylaminoacyl peptidase